MEVDATTTAATMAAGKTRLSASDYSRDEGAAFLDNHTLERKAQNDIDNLFGDLDEADENLVYSYPTFDNKHYYGIAGDAAALAVEDSEADKMAVYISLLCASAAMIGQDKYLEIGETKHHARIFCAIVGASSRARKGTSLKPVKRFIEESEKDQFITKSLSFLDGGLSSAEGLIYSVRDESEETDKNGMPEWEAVEDKRALVVEEEFANVLKQCQRDGNTLSSTLRCAWDGNTLAPLTKGNKLKATKPHINMVAHITNYELSSLMSRNDISNGLANRFLWCCSRRTRKLAYPKRMNDETVSCIAKDLARVALKSEGEGVVTLSEKARKYWDVEYHKVSVDAGGIVGSVTARAEAYVMRLSLLFCLLDGEQVVEKAHIEAACHVVEYCHKSAEYIFGNPEINENDDANKLLQALSEKSLSQTEVSRLFNGNRKKEVLKQLFNDLQNSNRIRQLPKGKGRKTIMWELV